MSAIACLAAVANINICHELAPKDREIIKKLSLPQSISYNQSPMDTIRVVLEEWLAGKSRLPPTWAEMMAVLREVGMNDLAARIEKYSTENGLSLLHEVNSVLLRPPLISPQDIGIKYNSLILRPQKPGNEALVH